MNRYFIQTDIQSLPGTIDLPSVSNQKAPMAGLNTGGRNKVCKPLGPQISRIAIVFVSNPAIELQIKTVRNYDSPDCTSMTQRFNYMSAAPSGHARKTQHPAEHTISSINHPASDLKMVEFSIEMPNAKTVQLAADFTDWEAAPIDLIRFGDGVWSTTVPLPPGVYAYRFLVDGKWFDDPRAVRRNSNSAGVAEACIK